MDIKAIDTFYGEHLFRSRLEARFGVYFDALNVKWEYESEGYELGNNDRYLPDFYFPDYKIFAEIKPIPYTFKEHSKCKRLALLTQLPVIELIGLPSVKLMNVIIPHQHYMCAIYGEQQAFAIDKQSYKCKCGSFHIITNGLHEEQAALLLKSDDKIDMPFCYGYYRNDDRSDTIVRNAIAKSKQARFEFNK